MARLVALRLSLDDGLVDAIDAAWADGDAVLPIDPTSPPPVLDGLLARLRPSTLVTSAGTELRTGAPPVPDGTALVIATSGSTGEPKGVVLSHAALAAGVAASRTRLGAGDGVPWLGVLPLHHVAGITVLLRSRAAGVEPTLHPRDTPEVIADAAPSWIALVPAQLTRLLDADVDLARHRGVLLGGAAAPPSLLARARDGGVRVVTSYGATETAGGCVYDGSPLDGVDVRVTEAGRLAIRTPTLATGIRTPNGSVLPVADADGWWTTADLGEVTDGTVTISGRADDVIITGGVNVPVRTVHAALLRLPEVSEAGVIGLPDARWGAAVTAVVVLGDIEEAAALTLAGLRQRLADELPATHRPTGLVVADSLPADALGKMTPAAVLAAVAAGRAHHER